MRDYKTLVARAPVVAIGNFDGVHVGHQRLLAHAVGRARALGGEAVVLTFNPHPAKLLAPTLAPPLICTEARKLELFAEHGIDAVVLEPFTRELAGLPPQAFVEQVLLGGLGAREIVVGYDFTYGAKRGGSVDTLRACGVPVHVIPAVSVDGLVASSTKIREFVLEGRVDGARVLLGRAFDVDGVVVRGAARGRQLGVPTANIAVQGELLPRPGIYATMSRLPGEDVWRPGATSLGTNPTFQAGQPLSLEVHLLDWEGDIYGATVRTAFHAWLRPEERFTTIDALVAQIRKDIEHARDILATHGHD